MCSRRIVSCCSDLALINVAKLSAGRQQLSPSPAWHRLFSQQQRLTFCAKRPDIDVGLQYGVTLPVAWLFFGTLGEVHASPLRRKSQQANSRLRLLVMMAL